MKKGTILITALIAIFAFGFSGINVAHAEGIVAGVVLDADGEAVAGAHVTLHGMIHERGVRPYREMMETNDEGLFGFEEVPAGRYLVQAGAPDLGRDSETIEVNDNEQTNVELRLQGHREREEVETGSVVGTVIDADGNAVEGAQVVIMQMARGRQGRNIRNLRTLTDANGAFSFDAVPVGNISVAAAARDLGRDVEQIEVVADQETEVELQLQGREDRGGGDNGRGNRGRHGGGNG